jgi:hypothetical protein
MGSEWVKAANGQSGLADFVVREVTSDHRVVDGQSEECKKRVVLAAAE